MQGGAGWRPVGVASYDLFLRCDSSVRNLRVSPDHNGRVTVAREGAERTIRLDLRAEGRLHYDMEGVTRQALFVMSGENLHMATGVASFVFHEVSPFPQVDTKSDAAQVLAPVAGKVSQMLVAVGDSVTQGQALMCVEAMKMEMWLTAQGAGQVVACSRIRASIPFLSHQSKWRRRLVTHSMPVLQSCTSICASRKKGRAICHRGTRRLRLPW